MIQVLVTGGAGFIGSHLVDALLQRGMRVRVVDNLATGRLENLAQSRASIEFMQASITDDSALQQAMQGVDIVFHQGALPSVPRSLQDPLGSHDANSTGTLKVLLAARDAGVKRVVYAASSSAYGNTPTLPKDESMPSNPISPYAIQKYTGEQYCRAFREFYGLSTVALRYFNVFGPRQNPNSQYAAVIPRFISLLLSGEAPQIHGDGEASRDFTFVENVVHANILAGECKAPRETLYNVACGERYTVNDLFERVRVLCGSSLKPVYLADRAGDVKHSLAAIDRAKRDLGYSVRVTFQEGLQRTVEWLKNQPR